jgi:hypothetical protein
MSGALAPATARDDARSVFDGEVAAVPDELGVDAEHVTPYRLELSVKYFFEGMSILCAATRRRTEAPVPHFTLTKETQ